MKNLFKTLMVGLLLFTTLNYSNTASCSATATALATVANQKTTCTACQKQFLHENKSLRHVLIDHEKVDVSNLTYGALYYAQQNNLDLTKYGLRKYSLPQVGKQQPEESATIVKTVGAAAAQNAAKRPLRVRKSVNQKRKYQESESDEQSESDESDSEESSDSESSSDYDQDDEDESDSDGVKSTKNKRGKFECEEKGCAQVFTDRNNMRRHVREQHQGIKAESNKPVKCNLCNVMQSNAHNLIRHQILRHGEKPYACYIAKCKKAFASYTEAKEHIQKVHKQQPERSKLQLDHKRIVETQHDVADKKKTAKKAERKPKSAVLLRVKKEVVEQDADGDFSLADGAKSGPANGAAEKNAQKALAKSSARAKTSKTKVNKTASPQKELVETSAAAGGGAAIDREPLRVIQSGDKFTQAMWAGIAAAQASQNAGNSGDHRVVFAHAKASEPFVCEVCNRVYSEKKVLERHKRINGHHNQNAKQSEETAQAAASVPAQASAAEQSPAAASGAADSNPLAEDHTAHAMSMAQMQARYDWLEQESEKIKLLLLQQDVDLETLNYNPLSAASAASAALSAQDSMPASLAVTDSSWIDTFLK